MDVSQFATIPFPSSSLLTAAAECELHVHDAEQRAHAAEQQIQALEQHLTQQQLRLTQQQLQQQRHLHAIRRRLREIRHSHRAGSHAATGRLIREALTSLDPVISIVSSLPLSPSSKGPTHA